MRMHLDPREFAYIHAHKCKCTFLRACSRKGLIKTQNAFAHNKNSQNSNALWVQKRSGCTIYYCMYIIDSVDSISRDERGFPLTQYITNKGISRARYTITHFKHHHCVLRLISNRMSV